MKRNWHHNVEPRYTPGSSAMVDEATAERVAREESEAYTRALGGVYGDPQRARAVKLGKSGIVEAVLEVPSKKGWKIRDLITGAEFFRTYREAKR